MSKKTFQVDFSGRVFVEFETDDYPHYAEGARGGWEQLAEDLVCDYARIDEPMFQSGTFEVIRPAAMEVANV